MSTMYFKKYEGIDGGDFILWMAWSNTIASMIKEWRLPAVAMEDLPPQWDPTPEPAIAAEQSSKNDPLIKRKHFPGGIRIAHFHHQGEIYLLNEEQWKKFTEQALNMVQNKIRKANTVDYQPLMELTEVTLPME